MLRKFLALTALAVTTLSPVLIPEAAAQPIFGKAPQTAVPNAWDSTTIIISSDTATISRGAHTLAAESGTADDLATVVTTNLLVGHATVVKADTGDSITLKNGTGNITTDTGADIVLTGTQRATLYVTASGVDASLGGGGGGAAGKATLAALQGTATGALTDGASFYVREAGRAGLFIWDSSDLSTEVTADPSECIYGAPDSDPTGASGAFKRASFFDDGLISLGGHCGADRTGVSDARATIINWIGAAEDLQGTAFFDRGQYLISAAIEIDSTGDISMQCANGGWLYGDDASMVEMLRLDDTTSSRPKPAAVSLIGDGTCGFDAGQVDFGGTGVGSGSAFVVQRKGRLVVNNVIFKSDVAYDVNSTNTDSLLVISDVLNCNVSENYLFGAKDVAIYITGGSGGSATDDGGNCSITDNVLEGNSGGIRTTRQAANIIVSENIIRDGLWGIMSSRATSGSDIIRPPENVQFNNNRIVNMGRWGIRADWAGVRDTAVDNPGTTANNVDAGGSSISFNQIIDWNGDDWTSSTDEQWRKAAIACLSCDGVIIGKNTARQVTHTVSESIGVFLGGIDIEGDTATSASHTGSEEIPSTTGNQLLFNRIENFDYAYYQLDGATNFLWHVSPEDTGTARCFGDICDHQVYLNGQGLAVGDTSAGSGYLIETDGNVRFNRNGSTVQSVSITGGAGGHDISFNSDAGSLKPGSISINGTEHFGIQTDGQVTLNNIPLTATLPSGGDMPVMYTGAILTSDPAGDGLLTIPQTTFTSVGFPDMSTWPDGIWLLSANRDAHSDACFEYISTDNGTYQFDGGSVLLPPALTCNWQENSGDLEFYQSRVSSDWQIKAMLVVPEE